MQGNDSSWEVRSKNARKGPAEGALSTATAVLRVPGARAYLRVQILRLPILLQMHDKARQVLHVLGA